MKNKMVITVIFLLFATYIIIGIFPATNWTRSYDHNLNSAPNNVTSFIINVVTWPLMIQSQKETTRSEEYPVRLSRNEALVRAQEYIGDKGYRNYATRDEEITEHPFGWVVPIGPASGKVEDTIPGIGPLVVDSSGTVVQLGSMPQNVAVSNYALEREQALAYAEAELRLRRKAEEVEKMHFVRAVPLTGQQHQWSVVFDTANTLDARVEIIVDIQTGEIISFKDKWS